MKKIFLLLILPLVIFSQGVFASEFGHNQYYFRSPTEAVIDQTIPKYQQDVIDYNLKLPDTLQALQKDIYKPEFYDHYEYNLQNQGIQFNPLYQNQRYNSSPYIQQNNNLNNRNNGIQNQPKEQTTPKWWRQENSYQGWGFN